MKNKVPKIVVYTAICGDKDRLIDPCIYKEDEDRYKRVAFIDKSIKITSSKWTFGKLQIQDFSDNVLKRNTSRYKILSHKVFPDVDYSIWLDGNCQLALSPPKLIDQLGYFDIGIIGHNKYGCLAEEAESIISKGKEKKDIIVKQINHYFESGYPKNNGLVNTCVMIRKHNKKVGQFNEFWWDQYCQFGCRDQLSLVFSLFKNPLSVKYFDYSIFSAITHNDKLDFEVEESLKGFYDKDHGTKRELYDNFVKTYSSFENMSDERKKEFDDFSKILYNKLFGENEEEE